MKHKISLVSPDAIRRHQANTSKTKIACAFSKSNRFDNPNPEYLSFYNIDAQRHSIPRINLHFLILGIKFHCAKDLISPRI